MSDRTVHGRTEAGSEIVRYDRAGKWYFENRNGRMQIPLDEAVFHVIQEGSQVFLGRPGGKKFDARVKARA